MGVDVHDGWFPDVPSAPRMAQTDTWVTGANRAWNLTITPFAMKNNLAAIVQHVPGLRRRPRQLRGRHRSSHQTVNWY